MFDAEEERLVEKLRKIEALFARSGTLGERDAAESALERIRQRLRLLEKTEPPIEFRFGLPDAWSKALFIALLRRYELRPYRYRGQRRTTVMVRATRTFVNDVLWPEFQQLNATLHSHMESVTHRVIQEAIHRDDTDIEERAGKEPGTPSLGYEEAL